MEPRGPDSGSTVVFTISKAATTAGLSFLVILGSGCGSDDDDSGQGGTGERPSLCEPNDGDGRTQCGGNTCEAGERCTQAGLLQCLPGCLETLNCGPGQWCDLRTANPGQPGLCRSIDDPACGGAASSTGDGGGDDIGDSDDGATEDGGSTGMSCPDVQGNYNVVLSGSSPEECQDLLSVGDVCSVSQDDCQITWGCDSDYGAFLVPGPVDASGVYETSGVFQGLSYACEVEFVPFAPFSPDLRWSCSIGQLGQAVLCEGTGSR